MRGNCGLWFNRLLVRLVLRDSYMLLWAMISQKLLIRQCTENPFVIIIDIPLELKKKKSKNNKINWKHHRMRIKKEQKTWRGKGGRSEGWWVARSEGVWGQWGWLTKREWQWGVSWHHQSHFPGWYTTTRTTEIREKHTRGHSPTLGQKQSHCHNATHWDKSVSFQQRMKPFIV